MAAQQLLKIVDALDIKFWVRCVHRSDRSERDAIQSSDVRLPPNHIGLDFLIILYVYICTYVSKTRALVRDLR